MASEPAHLLEPVIREIHMLHIYIHISCIYHVCIIRYIYIYFYAVHVFLVLLLSVYGSLRYGQWWYLVSQLPRRTCPWPRLRSSWGRLQSFSKHPTNVGKTAIKSGPITRQNRSNTRGFCNLLGVLKSHKCSTCLSQSLDMLFKKGRPFSVWKLMQLYQAKEIVQKPTVERKDLVLFVLLLLHFLLALCLTPKQRKNSHVSNV